MCIDLTRRNLLTTSGVAILSLPFLNSPAFARRKKRKTKHVIVVAFAGGVRSRETIGTPANVPNLMRIAQKGVIAPNIGQPR